MKPKAKQAAKASTKAPASPKSKDLKLCCRCGPTVGPKPRAEFGQNRSRPDGLAAMCRKCKRADDKAREPGRRGTAEASVGDLRHVSEVPLPSLGGGVTGGGPAWARRRGPPSTITPELIEQICSVLSRGHTRRAAARKAGVLEHTLGVWMQRGEELHRDGKDGPTAELYVAVMLAEGEGEYSLVELVKESASIDPHNAKWLLERRYSIGAETWARKEQLQVSGGEKPLEVSVVRELLSKKLDAFGSAEPPADPPPPETSPPAGAPDPGPAGAVPG